MSEQLHPARIFYRRHLARYAWARMLKVHALAFYFWFRHLKHVVHWRFRQSLHALIFNLARVFSALSLGALSLSHRFAENSAYLVQRRRHEGLFLLHKVFGGLGRFGERLAHRFAENSAYLVQRRRHEGLFLLHKVFGGLGRFGERLAHQLITAIDNSNQSSGISFFPLISQQEYCKRFAVFPQVLTPSRSLSIRMPEIYPLFFQQYFDSKIFVHDVPGVYAIGIADAVVLGKCDFIFANKLCISHGLHQFDRDMTAEEMHGMIRIDAKRKLVTLYADTKVPEPLILGRAVSLIGSASANYVHWLTETAPKLALLDEMEQYRDCPLLIDSDLHSNILASLAALNTYQRPLVFLKRGQSCQVGHLLNLTPVAYVPFEYRKGFPLESLNIDPSHAMYVPEGLRLLRKKVVDALAKDANDYSRRIYIRRTSEFRPMANAEQLEKSLTELGFEIVEPERLTFAEQVKLFSKASLIVAQAGAALGNLIFAPASCRVVILSAWSRYSNYYYFSNMADILGQHCTYILCRADETDNDHLAHKGFLVDLPTVLKAVA